MSLASDTTFRTCHVWLHSSRLSVEQVARRRRWSTSTRPARQGEDRDDAYCAPARYSPLVELSPPPSAQWAPVDLALTPTCSTQARWTAARCLACVRSPKAFCVRVGASQQNRKSIAICVPGRKPVLKQHFIRVHKSLSVRTLMVKIETQVEIVDW